MDATAPTANEPASPYVFVSYSSTDLAKVETIVSALEEAGFGVWFDRRDIPVGSIYGPEIVAGIERSDVLVIACSQKAFDSPHVRQEILLAFKYRRPPIPVMLEQLPIPRDLEYWIVGPQRVDAHSLDAGVWLRRLVAAVERISKHREVDGRQPASDVAPPGNLTVPATPLIGRLSELAQLRDLIGRPESRLVTLLGTGGTGKTRLALQAAAEQRDQFPDGIFLVELGPIGSESLVWTAVRQALGINEAPGTSIRNAIVSFLGEKRVLLVFDNCEHLKSDGRSSVAPIISDLLAAAPGLGVLATSREPLHLSLEQQYPVSPLPLPGPSTPKTAEGLMQFDAITLFVTRARAVKPAFTLTDENSAYVAGICVRLDGLPLAIELAAARIKLLTPSALLARLEQRLPLLTHGPIDLPDRQRTLRDTIAWSYDLLDDEEQRFLQRLSVFAGGWTIDAAGEVAGIENVDVILGLLASLIDKNLILQTDDSSGDPRFTMLATIREFARDALQSSGDLDAILRAHAAYFQELAAEARPKMEGAEQAVWLERLESEIENLREAMSWLIANEPEEGLQVATDLWTYWLNRAHYSEGKVWMETALAVAIDAPTLIRAKCLRFCGVLAHLKGENTEASELTEKSMELSLSHNYQLGVAQSLSNLAIFGNEANDINRAIAMSEQALAIGRAEEHLETIRVALNNLGMFSSAKGDYQTAEACYEENLANSRSIGSQTGIAVSLNNLGRIARHRGDNARAATYYEESLVLLRTLGDRTGIANVLGNLGSIARYRGDVARATILLEESLEIGRQVENPAVIAFSLANLGAVASDQHHWKRAAAFLQEGLSTYIRIGHLSGAVEVVSHISELLQRFGDAITATQLNGAAHSAWIAWGEPLPPRDQEIFDRQLALARCELGDDAFEAAWQAGLQLSLEDAIEQAQAALIELL